MAIAPASMRNPEMYGFTKCILCQLWKSEDEFRTQHDRIRHCGKTLRTARIRNRSRCSKCEKADSIKYFEYLGVGKCGLRFIIQVKLTNMYNKGRVRCITPTEELICTYTENCENCGKYQGRSIELHHCHTTGRFLGWLCGYCNTGMGRFSDDPVAMRKAADWLEERLNGH